MTTFTINRRRRLSLLDLLAVVTLLGFIAVIVVPLVFGDTPKAKIDSPNGAAINASVELHIDKGAGPDSSLTDIESYTSYFPGGLPIKPVDGASYKLNHTTNRVETFHPLE